MKENQEIDYKAEYEKMTAEKEREEVVSNFKKSMDEEGYEFDEEIFSANCSKYDNEALKNFCEMFKTLKPRSNRGFKIGATQSREEHYSQPSATFKDYIESKRK